MVISFENEKIVSIVKEGYDAKNAMPLVVPALIDLQIYGAENNLRDFTG
jgi:hypothetical protein